MKKKPAVASSKKRKFTPSSSKTVSSKTKKKAKPVKKILEDKTSLPVETTQAAPSQPVVQSATLAETTISNVPSVDMNASLKIEEIGAKSPLTSSPSVVSASTTTEQNQPQAITTNVNPTENIKDDVPTVDVNASLKVEETGQREEEVPLERSNKILFILGSGFAGLLIGASVVFLYFYWQKPVEKPKVVVPLETQKPKTKEETKPTLIRTEWTFEVQNGSGIAGAAKKEADKLEGLGYTVVSLGNADKSTYKTTQIFVKASFIDKASLLLEDIKTKFTIASVSGELTDSTASARIIVGKE